MTSPYGWVADLGGTHIRIALVGPEGLRGTVTWETSGFGSPLEALEKYEASISPAKLPRRAVVAVACPVQEDRVELTNLQWSFSIEQLRRDLGLDTLQVINDFTALALAIPSLVGEHLETVKPGTASPKSPVAVIGPGTGLGVSGLVPNDGGWLPLTTEGGHIDLAATTDREWQVANWLQERFGHASAERVLSGPGLANLYRAVNELEGVSCDPLEPRHIVNAAREAPGGAAHEATRLFCGWLGAVSGDLVLTLGARGGAYLGGGMIGKMGRGFDRGIFRSRFVAKGRFRKYLESVPVSLIRTTDAALHGAASMLPRP